MTTNRTADLGAVFDTHVSNEFVACNVDATMATMTADPYVNHVPTMMGGEGRDGVARFYAGHFIGHWPADTAIERVSRTVGDDRVVEEMVMTFTHDIVMDTFLPAVPPTGRRVSVAVVVVMGFDDGAVAYEHIYWDQATVLEQIGLLDGTTLPITGAIQAQKVMDRTVPANLLLHGNE
jgi:carboxymethylenebutenolidase